MREPKLYTLGLTPGTHEDLHSLQSTATLDALFPSYFDHSKTLRQIDIGHDVDADVLYIVTNQLLSFDENVRNIWALKDQSAAVPLENNDKDLVAYIAAQALHKEGVYEISPMRDPVLYNKLEKLAAKQQPRRQFSFIRKNGERFYLPKLGAAAILKAEQNNLCVRIDAIRLKHSLYHLAPIEEIAVDETASCLEKRMFSFSIEDYWVYEQITGINAALAATIQIQELLKNCQYDELTKSILLEVLKCIYPHIHAIPALSWKIAAVNYILKTIANWVQKPLEDGIKKLWKIQQDEDFSDLHNMFMRVVNETAREHSFGLLKTLYYQTHVLSLNSILESKLLYQAITWCGTNFEKIEHEQRCSPEELYKIFAQKDFQSQTKDTILWGLMGQYKPRVLKRYQRYIEEIKNPNRAKFNANAVGEGLFFDVHKVISAAIEKSYELMEELQPQITMEIN